MEIVEILKTIGACAGALVTIITFFTLISKRPRAALRKIIREESTEANKELANKIEELEKKVEKGLIRQIKRTQRMMKPIQPC